MMQDEEGLKSHAVFAELSYFKSFYHKLAFGIFPWLRSGVPSSGNIDSYLYSSVEGTLDSIALVLANLRISDAYALLRRFHDAAILNIYLDEMHRVGRGCNY